MAEPTDGADNVLTHAVTPPPASRRPVQTKPSAGPAVIIPIEPVRYTEIVSDPDGNFIARRVLHLDIARARGDVLSDVLDYWTTLRGDRAMPLFGDIDPVRLAQIGALGWVHILNAANPDPERMRIDLYGDKSPLDNGRIYTGLEVGDYPIRVYAQSIVADLESVRRSGEPRYFRVRNRLRGVDYRYARLALPFSTDGTRTDRVMVTIRPEPASAVPANSA